MANTLNSFRNGAVGFIDWLDLRCAMISLRLYGACQRNGNHNTDEDSCESLFNADRPEKGVALNRETRLEKRDDEPSDAGGTTDERGDFRPLLIRWASSEQDDNCKTDGYDERRKEGIIQTRHGWV